MWKGRCSKIFLKKFIEPILLSLNNKRVSFGDFIAKKGNFWALQNITFHNISRVSSVHRYYCFFDLTKSAYQNIFRIIRPRTIKTETSMLETGHQNLRQLNCNFTTISSHFSLSTLITFTKLRFKRSFWVLNGSVPQLVQNLWQKRHFFRFLFFLIL